MFIYDRKEPWVFKTNFVDINNVVLGFDMIENCCEDFGWFIVDEPCRNKDMFMEIKDQEKSFRYLGYYFDTEYNENITINDDFKDINIVIFKITNDEGDLKYIHLYNHHNGYYTHGFSLTKNSELCHNLGERLYGGRI